MLVGLLGRSSVTDSSAEDIQHGETLKNTLRRGDDGISRHAALESMPTDRTPPLIAEFEFASGRNTNDNVRRDVVDIADNIFASRDDRFVEQATAANLGAVRFRF